jgi:hypothetical protein
MKATMASMLVVIGIILGLMLNHLLLRPALSGHETAASASASAPVPPSAPVQVSTMVPATPRAIQAVGVYPCADPTDICDHLRSIGCSVRSCRDAMSLFGEDACLKIYETKTVPQARALGVTCSQ